MTVKNMSEAWNKANEIFPTDYEKDEQSSARAGYPVFRSTADGHYYDYICDLGDRLEINLSTGETINIWVKGDEPQKVETNAEGFCKVVVKARETGEVKVTTVDEFIASIRFFWGSGKEVEFEKKVNRMCETLKAENDHGDAMETIYGGLIVKVVYYRWAEYDRFMRSTK